MSALGQSRRRPSARVGSACPLCSESNCDLIAAISLIDSAASRLALRAPALRAATALTRPKRSAQRLLSNRHGVPTAQTIDPNHVITNHRIEGGDPLTH